ncbi:MAG: hypothetical protein P8X42_14030 [Calditrichaceae bacterium]
MEKLLNLKYLNRIFLIFTIVLLLYCDHPNEYIRDNPLDPRTPEYDPRKPNYLKAEIIDYINNIIKISWEDINQGCATYTIEKKENNGSFEILKENIKTTSLIDSGQFNNTYTYRLSAQINNKTSGYKESNSIYFMWWIPWKNIDLINIKKSSGYESSNIKYEFIDINKNLEILYMHFCTNSQIKILRYNISDDNFTVDYIEKPNRFSCGNATAKVRLNQNQFFIVEYINDIYKSYILDIENLTFDDKNCPVSHFPMQALKLNDSEILLSFQDSTQIFNFNERKRYSKLARNYTRTDYKIINNQDGRIFIIGGENNAGAVMPTEILNNKMSEWIIGPSLSNEYIWNFDITYLESDKYFIAGGIGNYSRQPEIINFSQQTISKCAKYKGNIHIKSIKLPDNKILVLSTNYWENLVTEIYDLNSNSWELLDDGPSNDGNNYLLDIVKLFRLDDGHILMIHDDGWIYKSRKSLF